MEIIKVPLVFLGQFISRSTAGVSFLCITPENVDEIELVEKMRLPLEVGTASRGHLVNIDHTLRSDFNFGDLRMRDEFMFVPYLIENAIICINTIQKIAYQTRL